mmetsp:Transcript_10020/g.14156  ORF Transcript_10020/g.14156 Transcript_10020/m.14156 type:complete len:453 (+) Transcript_10020:28-1386(+)
MAAVSGMAASIRGATESETFDLGGHTVTNINTTITSAFQEPLPLSDMIRITFVVGAGKLARQKYDDGAQKAVTSALRSLGFEEDRGASCVNECGGTFKSQHDTGKNLKTVVVFPKIAGGGSGGDGSEDMAGHMAGMSLGDDANDGGNDINSILPKGSPENMIAMSSQNVFERMLQSKCYAWHQKKGCVAAIESLKKMLEELDTKLLSGTPLEDAEQDVYDSVSMSALEEKEAFVKKEMHSQVESGKLTKWERETLIHQVTDKLETLQTEMKLAEDENKPKRLEKLKVANQKAEERKKMLEDIVPKTPHPLSRNPEISKLRVELRPLQQLEDGAKGRLLSVKETQMLARKEEILEEIERLENVSRGWFEDDDAFAARVQVSRATFDAKDKQKGGKKKPTGATGSAAGSGFRTVSASSWVTPGARKPAARSTTKKKKPAGGNVFGAMMMDSDSD